LRSCHYLINLVSESPQVLFKFVACPLLSLDPVEIRLADFLDSALHPPRGHGGAGLSVLLLLLADTL
jgi:hypothetical protein